MGEEKRETHDFAQNREEKTNNSSASEIKTEGLSLDEEESTSTSDSQKSKTNKTRSNIIVYDGGVGQIFKLHLLNLLLNIVTLGIYSFWGKTRIRRYLIGSFTLGGDRFEYTGTGGELFKGFLKAIPLMGLIYGSFIGATIIGGEDAIWPLLFLTPFFFIFHIARYAALRYRFSRTSWRSIRGFLDGSAIRYGFFAFWHTIINIVTLGIAIPFSDVAKHRYIVNTMYFGSVPVEFFGDGKQLLGRHIVTALLAVPTLGLSRLWYKAALMQVKLNGMSAGGLRLQNDVTGVDLLKLVFGNMLIIVLTLGLGFPFVIQRNTKFFSDHNLIIGDLDTSAVTQAENQKTTIGEGLDDIFDLDTGLI